MTSITSLMFQHQLEFFLDTEIKLSTGYHKKGFPPKIPPNLPLWKGGVDRFPSTKGNYKDYGHIFMKFSPIPFQGDLFSSLIPLLQFFLKLLPHLFLLSVDLLFFLSLFNSLHGDLGWDSASFRPIPLNQAISESFKGELSIFCLGSVFGGNHRDSRREMP